MARSRRDKPITGITFQGGEIDEGKPLETFFTRSRNGSFNFQVSPLVEVILAWRGTESRLIARKVWTRDEFTDAARQQLHPWHRIRV